MKKDKNEDKVILKVDELIEFLKLKKDLKGYSQKDHDNIKSFTRLLSIGIGELKKEATNLN